MRFIVYPEGQKRLASSPLKKKLDEGIKDLSITPSFGHITPEDTRKAYTSLSSEGFYSKLNPGELTPFKEGLQRYSQGRSKPVWSIQPADGDYTYNGGFSGMASYMHALTGATVDKILSAEDLANYKELGFDSFPELIGTIHAYIEASRKWSRPGGIWQTTHEPRNFETNFSASDHLDFAMYRFETTPHPTLDPLGNPVHFRPVTEKDDQTTYYNSHDELGALSIMLKWAYDAKLPSKLLENGGEGFIATAKKLNPGSINNDLGMSEQYAANDAFQNSLPTFGQEDSWQILHKINSFYRGPEDSLIIARRGEIAAEYYPEEIDSMLEGLCHQIPRGRSTLSQLVNLVNYRFSQDFLDFNAEFLKED